MWITSWNIRGCSNTLKICLLKRKIEKEKPRIIFWQETKCSGKDLTSIDQKIWKGCESIAIDAKGEAGGLGILWNPREVNLSILLETSFSISADFHILGTRIKGFLTNVYGPLKAEKKFSFLDSLSVINKFLRTNHASWVEI